MRFALRLSSRLLVPLLILLAACSDQEPAGSVGVPGVYVAGVVRDEDGSPVPLMTVTWEAWPAPDSAETGAVSDNSVRWFTRTDNSGHFTAHVGYYSIPVLDSIEVGAGEQECWGLSPLRVRERAIPVDPGTPDTVSKMDLTLGRAAPRARLAVGQACAAMVEPSTSEAENRFYLWIDELGDSVQGQWIINYQGSRGDDFGHFSGAREGNLLTLELRHDAPWEMCTGYTVELPVESGDTLGVGTSRSEGCPHVPVPLRFVETEGRDWPY